MTKTLMFSLLVTPLLLGGCGEELLAEGAGTGTEGAGTGTEGGTETVGDGDGDAATTGDGDGDTATTGDGDGDGDPIVFPENPVGDYARVDRAGMPGINMMLVTSNDAYNGADPEDDVNGDFFFAEITPRVVALHTMLDLELEGMNLMPATGMQSVAQLEPWIVPDTIKMDVENGAEFPNGRKPTDSVMDISLSFILLDHEVMDQGPATLVGLNPTQNDVEFMPEFPYLAAAH